MTIDNQPVNATVARIVRLLVANQEKIHRQQHGCLVVDFAPYDARIKLLEKKPLSQETTKE